jgi:hypothetical protein
MQINGIKFCPVDVLTVIDESGAWAYDRLAKFKYYLGILSVRSILSNIRDQLCLPPINEPGWSLLFMTQFMCLRIKDKVYQILRNF